MLTEVLYLCVCPWNHDWCVVHAKYCFIFIFYQCINLLACSFLWEFASKTIQSKSNQLWIVIGKFCLHNFTDFFSFFCLIFLNSLGPKISSRK